MMINYLAIPEDRLPDWSAAHALLRTKTERALDELVPSLLLEADEPTPEDVRAHLAETMERVESALIERVRDIDILRVPGWIVFASGGPSWGETPSQSFDDFWNLLAAGLAQAAGFADEPDHAQRVEAYLTGLRAASNSDDGRAR